MASDGMEMPPAPPEDQRDDGTDSEEGVPPDPETGKDATKSSSGKTGPLCLYTMITMSS